jgi:hypothetical protein
VQCFVVACTALQLHVLVRLCNRLPFKGLSCNVPYYPEVSCILSCSVPHSTKVSRTVLQLHALSCSVMHCYEMAWPAVSCTVLQCSTQPSMQCPLMSSVKCTVFQCNALLSTWLTCSVLYCPSVSCTVLQCLVRFCTVLTVIQFPTIPFTGRYCPVDCWSVM